MKKNLSSIIAVIFMSSMAFAQNIPMDASVRTGTLPNGLKYYIKKNTLPERKSISDWPSMPDLFLKTKTREVSLTLWSI